VAVMCGLVGCCAVRVWGDFANKRSAMTVESVSGAVAQQGCDGVVSLSQGKAECRRESKESGRAWLRASTRGSQATAATGTLRVAVKQGQTSKCTSRSSADRGRR
jgi:hypothetical protein